MRRILFAVTLLLVLAGLGMLFFGGGGPADATPESGDAAPAAAEPVTAGALERETTGAPQAAEAAAFDPRGLKVGHGAYGLHGTVVDERGTPVPNAWVASYSSPYPMLDFEVELAEILERPLSFDMEPVASTRADAEGKFRLEGMPGRSAYLVARAPKRLTRGRQPVMPDEIGSERGVLLHTVAGAELRGRVVDEFNAPVANAELFVTPSLTYLIQAIRTKEIYVERLFTDAGGAFLIEAVPAGLVLTATAFDGVTHPGARDVGPLPAGVSAETQLRLAETGDLLARVVDEDGNPVAGAKAVAVPLDLRMVPAFARDLPAWIRESGADGAVRWPQLPRRNYLLLAQGRSGRSAPYAAAVSGAGSQAPEPLVVQAKNVIEGRLVDAEGNGISGAKVLLASIPSKPGADANAERGRDGVPSAVEIFLQIGQEVLPLLVPAETWAVTGPSGRFRLPAWQDARLTVEVEGHPDTSYEVPELGEKKPALVLAPPGVIEGRVRGPDGAAVRFFAVNADLQRSFLEPPEVEMERQEGEDGRAFRARRDAAETAARGATLGDRLQADEVAVLPEETRLGEFLNTRLPDAGDGRFRIENLMPGTYVVEARAAGYVVARSPELVVGPAQTVSEVELVLTRGAMIRGRVLAAGTREPIAGALVWAGQGDESGFTGMMFAVAETMALDRTDADGAFELAGVENGADRIHALADGFAPTMIKGKALAEGDLREDVVIELKAGGTIQGRVLDRHGQPLPARMVVGFAMDSRDFWQTPTDATGNYRAANVKAGNYFIATAALDDEALFTGDFMSVLGGARLAQAVVKDGQTITVDITDLSAGGCRVRARVLLPDGSPVANAGFFAMAAEASMFDLRFATARSDAEGWMTFRSLAPGTYRLQGGDGDWNGTLDMEVPDLPEAEMVLQAPDGAVRGLVVSAQTGQPVPNATLTLTREDSALGFLGSFMPGGKPTEWGRTEDDGSFEFRGVAQGRYSLQVRADFNFGDEEEASLDPLGRLDVPEFSVGNNENRDVGTLRLPIASAIVVRVTSTGGDYDEGFRLRVEPEEGSAGEAEDGWGWRGRGRVSGLQPGRYVVIVEANRHATHRTEGVVVSASQTTELNVTLVEGVPLAARVLDQNGQPLPDAEIEVLDGSGRRVNGRGNPFGIFGAFGGGEDGSRPLGSFAPGSYRVRVTWNGQTREQGVALSSGQEETQLVEFTFAR